MSNRILVRPTAVAPSGPAVPVRVIKPSQFDDRTPQTDGMRRQVAVSRSLVGSEALWAGVMIAEPGTSSSVHHHGSEGTVVYVLSGPSRVRWGNRLEHMVDLQPGDFVFIPPYMPHQEINPSSDEQARWVVVRSGGEAIVVNLIEASNGEYGPSQKFCNLVLTRDAQQSFSSGHGRC